LLIKDYILVVNNFLGERMPGDWLIHATASDDGRAFQMVKIVAVGWDLYLMGPRVGAASAAIGRPAWAPARQA
jgi:hypothetical protein